MSIAEMFQLYGWWYVVLVALEIILLVVLFGGCLVLMYGDNRSWLYQQLSRFIDWMTEKYLQFITLHFTWDDEPECPEWADEELWKESLLEYKIK